MIAAMKTTHNPLRATLITIWAWPLVALLIVGFGVVHGNGLWFLCKSTWVLFAGVIQSYFLFVVSKRWKKNPQKWYITVVCVLTLASLLLLPFGLAKWDFYMKYDSQFEPTYVFKMNPLFCYAENIFASMALHLLVPLLPLSIIEALTTKNGSSFETGNSSGLRDENNWQDDVWKGGQVSDDFIGHRGEFDLNDEARRVSEDIQQFHNNHPDADLSDHYYWEDVLDADTDGYLEDN